MRIIYVTTSLPYGPGEAFVLPEIAELRRRGHTVLIVPRSPGGEVVHRDAEGLLADTVRQPLFSLEIAKTAFAEICRHPRRAIKALMLLRNSRSLKVASKNLAVYSKGLWLASVARQWRAEHIHAHWSAATSTMALIASEVTGIPWSFTAHRFDIVENNLLGLKIQKASLARFISQSGLEMARSAGIEAPTDKARVIHMGVNLPSASREVADKIDPPTILCPANLLPVKGHRYLIDAIALLKRRNQNVQLWIAGQGELRGELERRAAAADLAGRVRFLGQLSHLDVLRLYEEGRVGIVILPSIDSGNGEHEGIPVALIEAMSYGVPVISTWTGGIPELLKDGAGLLVAPRDSVALADAVEQLLSDAELGRRLARGGKERVRRSFAIEQVIDEMLAHFETAPENLGHSKVGEYSWAT